MKDSSKSHRIVFFNQMAGPLFRELAEVLSEKWPYGLLYTGHQDTVKTKQTAYLKITSAPEYKRNSAVLRLLSWTRYLVCAFFRCLLLKKSTLLFIVPFPPFLDLMAYFFKRLRGQRYVVLIYDIYPNGLVNLGSLSENGLITKLWRKMNRLAWENADAVFTIGTRIGENLERMFDSSKTKAGKVIVIPNWANTDWIRPIPKHKNEFAQKYNQVNKLTVMYSGNLGQAHDIETILSAIKKLKNNNDIHFMIIGDGIKKNLVEQAKRRDKLDNLTVLPLQPENVLPQSLTTADIAIVTLGKGSEGLCIPSKTYYSMAAGAALIGLCEAQSEVADIITHHQCGTLVPPGDAERMVNAITELLADKEVLNNYRNNGRVAAEQFYSRNNADQYIKILSSVWNI